MTREEVVLGHRLLIKFPGSPAVKEFVVTEVAKTAVRFMNVQEGRNGWIPTELMGGMELTEDLGVAQ